ncbi:MAG: hypothetical protein R3C14_34150 [Caldilineaceae bacterium]
MLPTKVVVIGAGSASFGLNTLSALLGSARLRGSHLALVDRNPERLALMTRLAGRLNQEWDAQMQISSHTHHADALGEAAFVVSAIEVNPREEFWQQDFELTLKHGVRQPYAENGGPGGLAHALRNVGPVLEIAHAMEQACPDAWFINYSNPMIRICDAIARYSKINVVGLCHQIKEGYGLVGYVLADELGVTLPPGVVNTNADPEIWPKMHQITDQTLPLVEIKAAGLNHNTWMLDIRDKRTGADLYPLVRARWPRLDPSFEPLTSRMLRAFGYLPVPGDQHLCEYLPWLSNPMTKPWEKYNIALYKWAVNNQRREDRLAAIARMAEGVEPVDALRCADSEGALEVIESIAGGQNHYHQAVNVPNRGQIANLPLGAIVETPGMSSGAGVQALQVGALPTPIAELCRREITVAQLAVDAAVHGDRQAALQSLLFDPVVDDIEAAHAILDDYLTTYRHLLPQFWLG